MFKQEVYGLDWERLRTAENCSKLNIKNTSLYKVLPANM